MEYVEGQQTEVALGKRLFRRAGCPGDKRKPGFNGRVNGMQKAETGHRSAGQGRLHGLSIMFPVEQAGVAEVMDLNEREEDKHTEADADPR
jgi:hypothetical protein